MCIPQIMAAMSTAGEAFGLGTQLQTFGTFMSVVSSLAQGVAGMQAADAQAKAYENQAKVKEAQSAQALEKAQLEARLLRERGERFKGTQKSLLGASGVAVNSGSALDLLADTAYGVESDVSMTKYNAQLEAWGFQTEAANLKGQASMAKSQGKYAMLGGILGAGSSLLTGAAMVADRTAEGLSTGLLGKSKKWPTGIVYGSTRVSHNYG